MSKHKKIKEFNYRIGDIVLYISPINFQVALVYEIDKDTGFIKTLKPLESRKNFIINVNTEHPEWYHFIGHIGKKNKELIMEEWKKWTHDMNDVKAAKMLPIIHKQGLLN